MWWFRLLNLLKTFRPRGVILFFLRTTRGERKSELIQIDCKEEERLGWRKKGRPRTCLLYFKITISVKQEFLVRSPLFNNKQSQSLTGKSKWYCVKCQSRRREKRQIARSKNPSQFLFFFSVLGFRPRSSRLRHSPLTRALELLWLNRKIRDRSQSSRSPFGSIRNAHVGEHCVIELKYVCKRGYW